MTTIIQQSSKDVFLYQQVIDLIENLMDSRTLMPGDKLPSLRTLSTQLKISVPTVRQAYIELERQGKVHSRPQSGYFVQFLPKQCQQISKFQNWTPKPVTVECCNLVEAVYDAMHQPDIVPLGIASPVMALSPVKILNRTMRRVMSRSDDKCINYAPVDGFPPLRQQLAYRYADQGVDVSPEQIIITNGAQEALSLALKAVANAGDLIAVESPTFFGILELIDSLGMLAIEISSCPDEGIRVDKLADAIAAHPIKACVFSTSINNPLGSMMPEQNRKKLVNLLEESDIPIIEDDVYGDLRFTQFRAKPARYYSKKNLVITASSFSKTAAPGYRVGWLIGGRFQDKIKRLKRSMSCSSPLLQQWTLTDFLLSGEYDRYLIRLRVVLKRNQERMRSLIAETFPKNTRVSSPKGGSVLWIELPQDIDSTQLFELALTHNIGIAPGLIFSPSKRFNNFIRLSYGHRWDKPFEDAIIRLGKLTCDLLSTTNRRALIGSEARY